MALKACYEKGIQTPVKVTLGFKNFYLYSSVNSADGGSFTLLPPYCKELNLVERLWKYIKDNVIRGIVIKNKIFETLLELKLAVCDFVKNLSVYSIKSVCGYNYNVL